MSQVKEDLIRKLVRELVRQELDEANSTASVGGSYNTPHAFGGSNKKGKGKGKAGYTGGHTEPTDGTGHFIADDPKLRKESVNEGSISPAQAGKLFDKLLKKQTKGNLPSPKDIETVFSLMRKKYGIKSESINEAVKTHTIQGNKRWMIKTALPILKNYGIKKVKVNNVGKTNFFYFKITFDTDSNTLKKLDGELKRKNKKSNNYSGIVETLNDSVNEAGGVVTAWIQQKPKGYWAVFNKKGQSQFEGNKKFMINILKKASTLSPNAIGSILDRARFGDKHLEFKAQFSRYYFNESVKVFESTKEYEKSLDKIANDKTLKMMSKKDRDTLKKIADLIKKNRGK